MLTAAMSCIALFGLIAILGSMFATHWAPFRSALLGQRLAHAIPQAPPAETNVVMLRPPARHTAVSRPHRLAQAA